MASTYKRPQSAVWQCQYYVRDAVTGELRKIRKSTGSANRKKAQAIADDWERLAQSIPEAGSDRATEAKRILTDAVAEIDREKFTALSAREYLNRLLRVATGEGMEHFTLETWVAEWLRRKRADKASKATMARYTGHTEAFLDWLGDARRSRPLESVTIADANRWRESLLASGLTGKTVLSYLKDLGQVYRAAMREAVCAFNPFPGAISATSTDDSHERKPFTEAELSALLAAAPSEEWRGLILVGAFTGLRLGDAACLSWDCIDLTAGTLEVMPGKTKRKKRIVTVPIHPELAAYFMSAPLTGSDPGQFVFPTLARVTSTGRESLSQQFVAIMAAAGVSRGKPSRDLDADGDADKGKGRVTWERGFHSLRHSFTSWLRAAGVSEEDRMSLVGHSTRDSHKIYSHAEAAALKAAIEKLPSLTTP